MNKDNYQDFVGDEKLEELQEKLAILYEATDNFDDDGVREALRKAVPTFVRPDDVNNKC